MSLMMRGRNRGDVGARTYCNMFDSPLPALDITAAFVVVPALPKYVFFSSSPGINFTHQNMGWDGMLLPSPFSCFRLRRGFTEASNLGGAAVQSNPHCGISVRRPQNILRPSSSSRRRRLLASDSSADRGVFTLGRLGTHFVLVPCQLFDLVTLNFLHLQFYTQKPTNSKVNQ